MTSVQTAPALVPQISGEVWRNVDGYREEFTHAQPFKHLMIDGFFEPSFAENLLAEFPSFNRNLATNEAGREGGKSVNTRIREISPAFQQLYETISSKPFLEFASRLSGIPNLLLDPKMYGGGTHDNLHGQELDPHVDFNYDEARQLHRRLNLIVYMNKEWKTEWGGAIEIHSNPRKPYENQIRAFDPLFNRAVMFETNEYSWHGFPKIDLPEDKRHLSRKSISIYLYTKDRPADEIAPLHGTFYVQRPLPKKFVAGYALTEEDAGDLARLLIRRDEWIELYQKMEIEKNRYIANLERGARAPVTGYGVQEGAGTGLYADGWAATRLRVPIRPLMPVSQIVLRGWCGAGAPRARVRMSVDGAAIAEIQTTGQEFEISAPFEKPQDNPFAVEVALDFESPWSVPGDARELGFVVQELRLCHPGVQGPGGWRRVVSALRRARG